MLSPARDGLLDLLRRRTVVAPMAGGMSLWAGQGYRMAAERPAAEIIERMRG
jgi:hypothetical protein